MRFRQESFLHKVVKNGDHLDSGLTTHKRALALALGMTSNSPKYQTYTFPDELSEFSTTPLVKCVWGEAR